MITPVDNVNFQGRFHFNGYSKRTPKARPYEEFHFMPELKKKNPINEISESMKKMQKNLEAKWDSLFYRLNHLFY